MPGSAPNAKRKLRKRVVKVKKSDNKIGHTRPNGKGRPEKVVDMGPQYKLFDGQGCDENMRYEIVRDGNKKNRTAGEQHNMSLASFASWCKEEVE